MKNEQAAKLLRLDLDSLLKHLQKAPRTAPKRGSIHNVREALGMSTAQLGRRLKISQSGVVTLEQSEEKATMQLATLRRAAKALSCELVYTLVPKNRTLENELYNRRLIVAENGLHELMRGSSLTAAEKRELIKAYAARLKRKKLWE